MNGERYPSLEEAKLAGLFHPNCGHRLYRYIPEATKLSPNDDNDIVKSEELYTANQKQREIERYIRKWKRRAAVAGDDATAEKIKAKIKGWTEYSKKHAAENNIRRKTEREGIGKTRYGNNPANFY